MAEYTPRLKVLYQDKIVKDLEKELNIKNINQVPKLEKVIVSCGVGKRLAKKSIATFKIRKGMGAPVGYLTTLRNDKMYEFVDRFINIALPHVRDFHGVPSKSFDEQGNYSVGLKEQTVFPEITFEDASVLHGLEITFIIKNGSKEASRKLLEAFGMPFEKKENK